MKIRLPNLWRLDVLLVGAAMALPLLAAGASIAQVQSDREERRVERRVDALKADYDKLQLDFERRFTKFELDNEKRMTRMETLMQIGIGIVGLIATAVAGMATMWVKDRRALRVKDEEVA